MPSADPTIKTTLRLPKSLHEQIEQAAVNAGLTVNGEMVYRLQHDPRTESASAVLEIVRERDMTELLAQRKQIAALWNALDRADVVLDRVVRALALAKPSSDATDLKREAEFARELIDAMRVQR